jgi:hypothetical protein
MTTDLCNHVILILSSDPGGSNAVVPVIQQLRITPHIKEVRVLAYRHAVEIMQRNGIPFYTILEDITESGIDDMLRRIQPSVIITGTSFNTIDIERKVIRAGRNLGIPSIVILDSWSNYSARFTDDRTKEKILPDKIAIMDDVAFEDMVAEGFPKEILVVTGQPSFDTLAEEKIQFGSDEKKDTVRKTFGIHKEELFIIFLSQPLSALYGEDSSNPFFLGYSEKKVISSFVSSLEKIANTYHKAIVLLIRPHPREKHTDYEFIKSDYIRIVITAKGNPREQMMSSDLVAGMSTILLVEACYLGCIVISLQPELKGKDWLPTNIEGYSIPVYTQELLYDTVKNILLDQEYRMNVKKKVNTIKFDGNATERIVNEILHLIGQ